MRGRSHFLIMKRRGNGKNEVRMEGNHLANIFEYIFGEWRGIWLQWENGSLYFLVIHFKMNCNFFFWAENKLNCEYWVDIKCIVLHFMLSDNIWSIWFFLFDMHLWNVQTGTFLTASMKNDALAKGSSFFYCSFIRNICLGFCGFFSLADLLCLNNNKKDSSF